MKGLYLRPHSGLSFEDCQDVLKTQIGDHEWRVYLRGNVYLLSCDEWQTSAYLRVGGESWLRGKDFKEVTANDLMEVCV